MENILVKMLIKQELVNQIKDHFNLNIYETKVWIALLGKGIASAGEIAEISGVPRSRTYDVLESLEKRGFTILKLGILETLKFQITFSNVIDIDSLNSKNEAKEIEIFVNSIIFLKIPITVLIEKIKIDAGGMFKTGITF